jgi:hypothetical protein
MASRKKQQSEAAASYRGRRAKTGNSLGLRFDKALFQSHPEFSGEVRAHVIAPGRMLVVAEPAGDPRTAKDPVIEAFLGFLAKDMAEAPHRIKPLDAALANRIHNLVERIPVNADEDLGDESLL